MITEVEIDMINPIEECKHDDSPRLHVHKINEVEEEHIVTPKLHHESQETVEIP